MKMEAVCTFEMSGCLPTAEYYNPDDRSLYENLKSNVIFATNKTKQKKKLRGLSPQANYTDRLSDRRLSAKLVSTLPQTFT
jgi:hypothetical protein